jgi:DUF1365 family protein
MDYVDVSGAVRYWWGGLYREDHFGDPCVPLHLAVRQMVVREVCRANHLQEHRPPAHLCASQAGVFPTGCVDLLCSLRAYGYCFNPISLFFVWNGEDRKHATIDFIVAEVNSIKPKPSPRP